MRKIFICLISLLLLSSLTYAIDLKSNTIGTVTVNAVNLDIRDLSYLTDSMTVTGSVTINNLLATTPTIYNVTCTTSNIEYSQAISDETKAIQISVIDGADTDNFRIAFTTGKVATPTAPYLKFDQNIAYYVDKLYLIGKTVYVASSADSKVIQIIEWK